MIGKLKGKLVEVDGNIGLVETKAGIYYRVYLTPRILQEKEINQPVEVYTYLQVSQDDLTLYGFENKNQYDMFRMLIAVSGIGPKSAFNIISFAQSERIVKAVAENDLDYLVNIPGLGKKTAQKIMLELSSKLGEVFDLKKAVLSKEDKIVVDALASLGFNRLEVRRVISKVDKKLSIEERIRQAIKLTAKK